MARKRTPARGTTLWPPCECQRPPPAARGRSRAPQSLLSCHLPLQRSRLSCQANSREQTSSWHEERPRGRRHVSPDQPLRCSPPPSTGTLFVRSTLNAPPV